MTGSNKEPLRILTNRFEIITLLPEMVDDLFMGWMKQPSIQRQFPHFSEHASLEDLRAFIERLTSPKWQMLSLRDKSTGQAIGFIIVSVGLAKSVVTHHAIGNRRWWGKGVIHEARAALIEVLFQMGINKIIGLPRANSRGAVSAYRDQGFVQEGVLREHYENADGSYDDAIAFGLLRHEWDFKAARRIPEKMRIRAARR